MPRRSLWLPLGILFACLAILVGCKKKPVEDAGGGGGSEPGPTTITPPAAVSSDYLVFARVDVKSVREGALFGEVKQAIAKNDGAAEWDKMEGEAIKNIGIKPTEIDTVTACVLEMPKTGTPKAIVIVAANKAFDKTAILRDSAKKTADSRGFYEVDQGELIHFPDDKTLVYVDATLAQKYLEGYGKNRTGWPMTADLTRAASGHVLFAVANLEKLPADIRNGPLTKPFAPLLAARTVSLTADLKGKELTLGARAAFADATAAGQAKEMVQGFVGMAAGEIDRLLAGKLPPEMTPFLAPVKEAQRAVKATKLEVSGSDLTLAASYKADFDIGQMVASVVKQMNEAGPRMIAQNNLKQIGLALHNYHDATNRLLVYGVGANNTPLKNATEKPLLSWRVAILPYIEQGNLYKQFKLNEPWDSENNKKLIDQMPKIYASANGKPGFTHLQMVVGPNAMQPMIGPITSITDGTSNTVAVIEAAEPVIWTKPGDIMLPAKLAPGELKKKIGGQFPGGFNVLMWDCSVRFVKDTVSERTLSLAVNPNDGQPLGSDW